MWLPQKIIQAVTDTVDEVFYVSFQTAKVFNEGRERGTPMVFSGWYWARGTQEGGPFKSQSSAYRDAWYELISNARAPALHKAAASEIRRQERQRRREAIGLRRVA